MYIRKILTDTTLIMLEKTMYLAIILLLVQIITGLMVSITGVQLGEGGLVIET